VRTLLVVPLVRSRTGVRRRAPRRTTSSPRRGRGLARHAAGTGAVGHRRVAASGV